MTFLFSLGPFGERDDQQVFIQKVVPITNKLFVRLSSTGKRYLLDLSGKEAGLLGWLGLPSHGDSCIQQASNTLDSSG